MACTRRQTPRLSGVGRLMCGAGACGAWLAVLHLATSQLASGQQLAKTSYGLARQDGCPPGDAGSRAEHSRNVRLDSRASTRPLAPDPKTMNQILASHYSRSTQHAALHDQ